MNPLWLEGNRCLGLSTGAENAGGDSKLADDFAACTAAEGSPDENVDVLAERCGLLTGSGRLHYLLRNLILNLALRRIQVRKAASDGTVLRGISAVSPRRPASVRTAYR